MQKRTVLPSSGQILCCNDGAQERVAPADGYTDLTIAAGTWAVFASRGPMPGAIQEVWKRIYSEWFPSPGYEHADRPDLEVYPEGDSLSADYYCEVWLPVRKAGET